MLTETTDYAKLYRDFRWNVPARFNIATACCDRHADGTGRLALVYVDDKGGRAELAAQEREEIAIISAYLPKQMSEADIKAAIAAAIAETNAAGIKDMGKVIGALKAKYTGQMDFGKASGMVKAALTG